jgi:hypothetical protein
MRTRLLLLSLLAGTVTGADEPKDPVDATWRARKELAQSRIAKGGLDACDLALEKAFQTAKLTKEKEVRSYDLTIEVDGRMLGAFYRYTGDKLDGFALVALPSQWVAYQKPDSKTIRFVVAPPQDCAFSLCTKGPTPNGPCEKARP